MTPRYIPSNARTGFESSLIEINNVINIISPPRRVDPDIKNYILGAAILFLSAKLENYISDLFNGICQRASSGSCSVENVPAELLGWAFLSDGHFDRSCKFVAKKDEGDFIKSTGAYLQKQLLKDPDNYLNVTLFKDISDRSYPSVKNIKRMFRRIGVESIFSLLNCRLHTDAENILKTLNVNRGALAHSGLSGSISYGDVKNQILQIRKLVAAIDKETFYHFRKTDTVGIWPS